MNKQHKIQKTNNILSVLQLNDFPLIVAVVDYPNPSEGSMAEDHGATEAGPLPRAWTKGRTETESRQRASGAKRPCLGSAE